jgi:hypothetical protein
MPDGRRLKIKELANEVWNVLAETVTHGTVHHRFVGLKLSMHVGEIPLPGVVLTFDMDFQYRHGYLDITQSQGIYHVEDGSYQTGHMAIGPWGDEIFATWETVTEDEFKKLQPGMILHTRSDLSLSNFCS